MVGLGAVTKGKDASAPPELYNLTNDLGETKNVAQEHPDTVRELTALWERVRTKGRSRP